MYDDLKAIKAMAVDELKDRRCRSVNEELGMHGLMNNSIIRCRTGELEFVGPLFVEGGAGAHPVFGWRSHHHEPEELRIGRHGKSRAAVGLRENVAVSAGTILLMSKEPVAPACLIELGLAEALRASEAFEMEPEFCLATRDFEFDGIVAVVLGALFSSDLEPVLAGAVE